MFSLAEDVNKSRWVCGVGIYKGEILFDKYIYEHIYFSECYLLENERLLKKLNILISLALSNLLFVFQFIVEFCCF